MYRPPKSTAASFVDELESIIDLIDDGHIEIWVTGDTDINLLEPDDADTERLEIMTASMGLQQKITSCTRPGGEKGTCLDHIMTNSAHVSEAHVLPDLMSDHLPVMAARKINRERAPISSFQGRSYRNYDRTQLREDLAEDDWTSFYAENDPANQWDIITQRITVYLDSTCPVKDCAKPPKTRTTKC